jgi:hypothetical protein
VRELMRDNEYNSETKQTKPRSEKGHLSQEVKMANEIVCDHVWDKVYPHFYNLM